MEKCPSPIRTITESSTKVINNHQQYESEFSEFGLDSLQKIEQQFNKMRNKAKEKLSNCENNYFDASKQPQKSIKHRSHSAHQIIKPKLIIQQVLEEHNESQTGIHNNNKINKFINKHQISIGNYNQNYKKQPQASNSRLIQFNNKNHSNKTNTNLIKFGFAAAGMQNLTDSHRDRQAINPSINDTNSIQSFMQQNPPIIQSRKRQVSFASNNFDDRFNSTFQSFKKATRSLSHHSVLLSSKSDYSSQKKDQSKKNQSQSIGSYPQQQQQQERSSSKTANNNINSQYNQQQQNSKQESKKLSSRPSCPSEEDLLSHETVGDDEGTNIKDQQYIQKILLHKKKSLLEEKRRMSQVQVTLEKQANQLYQLYTMEHDQNTEETRSRKATFQINSNDEKHNLIQIVEEHLLDTVIASVQMQQAQLDANAQAIQKNQLADDILQPKKENLEISTQVLKAFGISIVTLNLIKTKKEKQQYIIQKMVEHIKQITSIWKQRNINRDQINEKNENQLKKKQEEDIIQGKINNQFSWLNLKTDYKYLQNELKSMIVRKMNEYENSSLITQKISQTQGKGKSYSMHNKGDYIPLNLLQQTPATKSTYSPMKTADDSSYLTPIHVVTDNENISNSPYNLTNRSNNYSNLNFAKMVMKTQETNIEDRQELMETAAFQDTLQNNFLKNLDRQSILEQNIGQDKETYQWTQQQEEVFLQNRSYFRKLHRNKLVCSNFNLIGNFTFHRELLERQKKKEFDREKILQDIFDGRQITAEQLNYLNTTNTLLNKFIDKDYMKKAVAILKQNDILQKYELILAENIIKMHQMIQKLLNFHRQSFLDQQNAIIRKSIKEIDKAIEKKKDLQQRQDEHKHLLRITRTVSSAINKKMQRKKSNEGLTFFEDQKYATERRVNTQNELNNSQDEENLDIINNSYNSQDKKKEGLKAGQLKDQKEIIKQLLKPLNCEQQDQKKIKKHQYHPPSKINICNTKIKQKMFNLKKDMDSYKLNIQSSTQQFKQPIKFANYYSGGPNKKNISINFYNGKPIEYYIIKIQSFVRSQLARKQYNQMKRDYILLQESKRLQTQSQSNYSQSNREQYVIKDSQILNSNKKKNSIEGQFDYENQYQFMKQQEQIINEKFESQYELQNKIQRWQQNYNLVNKIRLNNIIDAVQHNNIVKLMQNNFDVHSKIAQLYDKYHNTVLYYAAKKGNPDICKFLLERGAQVNQLCSNNNTAMHMAFQSGQLDIIKLFLDNGGNLNILNREGYTPLAFASQAIRKYLNLDNGIIIGQPGDLKTKFNNHTLLYNQQNQEQSQQEGILLLEREQYISKLKK